MTSVTADAPGGAAPIGEVDEKVRLTLLDLARSGGWSVVAYGAVAGSAFVVSILLGRALGPATFGRYSFYLWLLKTLGTVVALGVPNALLRFVPEKMGAGRAEEARGLVRLAVRVHATLAIAAVVVAGVLFAAGVVGSFFVVVVGGVGVAVLLLDYEAVLAGLRRFRALALVALGFGALQVVTVIAAVRLRLTWDEIVVLFVSLAALAMVSNWAMCTASLRRIRPHRLPRADVAPFLRYAGVTTMTIAIETVLWGRPEIFFIAHFESDAAVGFYSAALRIASLSAILPLVASRPLLPEFARLRGEDAHDRLAAVYGRVCAVLVVLAAPVAFIGATLAGPALAVVYGSEYEAATTAAGILLVGSLVGAITGPVAAAVLSGPQPGVVVRLGVVAVALNLVLNVLLVPVFGIEGAATANVAVQGAWAALGIVYAAKRQRLRYPLAILARATLYACGGAAAAAAVSGAVSGIAGLLLAGSAGVLVYVGLLAATRHRLTAALARPTGRFAAQQEDAA